MNHKEERLINLYINLQVAEKKKTLFERMGCEVSTLKLRIELLETEIRKLESTCCPTI